MDFRPRPESTSQKRVAPCKAPNTTNSNPYLGFSVSPRFLPFSGILRGADICLKAMQCQCKARLLRKAKQGPQGIYHWQLLVMCDMPCCYTIQQKHTVMLSHNAMLEMLLRTRRHSPRYDIWPVPSYTILSTRCDTSHNTMLSHDKMLAIWRCIKHFPAEAKIWCEVWCSNSPWIRKNINKKDNNTSPLPQNLSRQASHVQPNANLITGGINSASVNAMPCQNTSFYRKLPSLCSCT